MQVFQITMPETNWHGSIFTLHREAMDIARNFSIEKGKKTRLLCYKATGDASPINGCIRLEMFNYFDFKDGELL